jgi:CBS domain-containing membrane protein
MTSDFVHVPPEASPFLASDLITRHGIRHLPVVSSTGHCLAVLGAATIVRRVLEAEVHDHAELLDHHAHVGPTCVLPNTPLTKVAAQMIAADKDACVVVDAHGKMLGLITARDLVAAIAGTEPRRRSRAHVD